MDSVMPYARAQQCSCIVSKSTFVLSVALNELLFGRYSTCIGHDASFLTQRFSCTVQDTIESLVNSIVRYHCNAVSDDYCFDVVNSLYVVRVDYGQGKCI